MGASAAAAIIIRKERHLVEHFRRAGALSPASAQSVDELDIHPRLVWERLVSRAIVREAAPGLFYLDEPSWEAFRRTRRRLLISVVGLALLAMLLLPYLTGKA